MLIRPDACVAWIGDENGTDGLEEALQRSGKSFSSVAPVPNGPRHWGQFSGAVQV
jgi:hypothetical protein